MYNIDDMINFELSDEARAVIAERLDDPTTEPFLHCPLVTVRLHEMKVPNQSIAHLGHLRGDSDQLSEDLTRKWTFAVLGNRADRPMSNVEPWMEEIRAF
jgi:hypothetical protein